MTQTVPRHSLAAAGLAPDVAFLDGRDSGGGIYGLEPPKATYPSVSPATYQLQVNVHLFAP